MDRSGQRGVLTWIQVAQDGRRWWSTMVSRYQPGGARWGLSGTWRWACSLPHEAGGRRRYTIDDVYRVAATLRGKQAGLSLDQIEQVIITTDPTSRTASCVRTAKSYNAAPPPSTRLKIIDSVLRCRTQLRSVPQLSKSDQRPDRRAHPVLVKIAPALVFVRDAPTASTSAVTGSAHHHPNSALSSRPRSAAEET
jgi:DNA-binding transcriptional MerR regulator